MPREKYAVPAGNVGHSNERRCEQKACTWNQIWFEFANKSEVSMWVQGSWPRIIKGSTPVHARADRTNTYWEDLRLYTLAQTELILIGEICESSQNQGVYLFLRRKALELRLLGLVLWSRDHVKFGRRRPGSEESCANSFELLIFFLLTFLARGRSGQCRKNMLCMIT